MEYGERREDTGEETLDPFPSGTYGQMIASSTKFPCRRVDLKYLVNIKINVEKGGGMNSFQILVVTESREMDFILSTEEQSALRSWISIEESFKTRIPIF